MLLPITVLEGLLRFLGLILTENAKILAATPIAALADSA